MNASPWIILLSPLVALFIIVLVTERAKKLSSYISVAAIAISFVFSLGVFVGPDGSASFNWIDLGSFQVKVGYLINDLTKLMLLIVTGVGLLIHIYSIGYMAHDKGRSRYFAGLSLFTFSMLGIVLANNFIMMFIFWELVGVSSYILIGHWFYRPAPPDAANKAMLANRIGDFGFMLGILLVWSASGTVSFDELGQHWSTIGLSPAFMTAAALLIFCGAVGKSAQFPLHVWLPDAMEGPTPVSALIHAATMVAAGVFMLARSFFLFQPSAIALTVVLWIGLFTSVLAALMATQQDDIKRILAYSTLSELGLMMGAIGLGAPQAGMFHLFTHASFKALLFLGAGSVIHSLDNEQNIWRMGGLQKRMPVTFWTFLIGSLALTACPPFSGFWSEDEILAASNQNIFAFLVITVIKFLTAYFVARLFVVAFLGEARTDQATHAHESPSVMTIPLVLLAIPACVAGFPFISSIFIKLPEHEGSLIGATASSFVVIAAGVATAYFLYKDKTKDTVDIPLFEHKFYFDEFYAGLIKWTQDLLAKISGFVDRWVIDGSVVRGLGGLAWGVGFALRFLQVGNLQAYAFLFGAGVVLLLYYILFAAK
ncbi:MAG TPA: NADH-quinone oxidoreductase subunit L [Chthoniobacterales bacterium]|jgi:NADH-quinone oxidoreductase subunit L|nr:NADH-quinone oxidoreductase subunit L [Chthoniobacterales bacterium]